MRLSASETWKGSVPLQHRANFFHLTLDIAWFGVLNGSAIAFAAVYAARLGASALQIGLLSAGPALITLALALPSGRWLQKRPIRQGVFRSSIFHRGFYLFWIFLPLAFTAQNQVWVLVALVALMSIPGTAMNVGFNGLFAAVVPPEWRAQVAGTRNAAFALTSIIVTLLCGWILARAPFPLGYQIVFAIGFISALMSSLHLWYIRPPQEAVAPSRFRRRVRDWAQPGLVQVWHSLRTSVGQRLLMQQTPKPRSSINVVIKDRRFRLVLLLIFLIHLTLILANPLFPIYLVTEANFSDQEIALGTSVFYLALFLGSLGLAAISKRLGHQRTLAFGMLLTCLYPAAIALTQNLPLYLLASVLGGLAWSMAGGAMGNYVLEEIPEQHQADYLAWYNISLQAGVLAGALLAPVFVDWVGIVAALFLAAGGRLLTGIAMWLLRAKSTRKIA